MEKTYPSECQFLSLPIEILAEVCLFMGPRDTGIFISTCKMQLTQYKYLWSCFFIKEYGLSPESHHLDSSKFYSSRNLHLLGYHVCDLSSLHRLAKQKVPPRVRVMDIAPNSRVAAFVDLEGRLHMFGRRRLQTDDNGIVRMIGVPRQIRVENYQVYISLDGINGSKIYMGGGCNIYPGAKSHTSFVQCEKINFEYGIFPPGLDFKPIMYSYFNYHLAVDKERRLWIKNGWYGTWSMYENTFITGLKASRHILMITGIFPQDLGKALRIS